jgi:hypothetical protein
MKLDYLEQWLAARTTSFPLPKPRLFKRRYCFQDFASLTWPELQMHARLAHWLGCDALASHTGTQQAPPP